MQAKRAMILPLEVLCVLVPLMFASAQSGSCGFKLDAMCSTSGAAVKWTVLNEGLAYSGSINKIHYSCTDSNTGMWSHREDACFHRSVDNVSLGGTDPLSMSHIVGRELPTGTICVFTAELQDTYGTILCNETANCTVGESSTLPASCDVSNSSSGMKKKCSCSCSPGFEGNVDTYGGNTCEAINITIEMDVTVSSTNHITPSTSMLELSTTNSITPSTSMLELSMTSILVETYVVVVTPTPSVGMGELETLSSDHGLTIKTELFEAISKATGMLSPTPTPLTQYDNSAQRSNLIMAFTLSSVLILVIIVILGLMWVVIVCRNNKLRRSHDKLAMPFEALRFERIDQDFNPIDISKMIFVSESMPSLFHTFGSEDPSLQLEKEKDSAQSTRTEIDSLAKSREFIALNETDEEETILKDGQQISLDSSTDMSSGYVTDSIMSGHLYEQTKEYIKALNFENDQNSFTDCDEKPVSIYAINHSLSTVPNMEAPSDYLVTNDDTLHTSIAMDSNEVRKYLWNANAGSSLQPADYILPTFAKPQIFFNFPKEMMHDN